MKFEKLEKGEALPALKKAVYDFYYEQLLKGKIDKDELLADGIKIIDDTIEYFISKEEYEKCSKLLELKDK